MLQDDPLCVERSVDEEDCCVVVLCASHTPAEAEDPCEDAECGPNAECKREVITGSGDLRDLSDATICVCREGYTGDPDSDLGCSLASSRLQDSLDMAPEDACVTQNSTYNPGETWYDGCDYRCSCNNKEILCESRCKIITENLDSRSGCELSPDPEDACCQVMVCPSTPQGESYPNVSILQPSLPSDGCEFKNATYAMEERWYDGCAQQCQCMGFGDVFCLPRCQPTQPELGEDCYTLPDVTDNCCTVTVCDKPRHVGPDVVKIQLTNSSAPGGGLEKQPRMNDLPAAGEGEIYIGRLEELHHGVKGSDDEPDGGFSEKL